MNARIRNGFRHGQSGQELTFWLEGGQRCRRHRRSKSLRTFRFYFIGNPESRGTSLAPSALRRAQGSLEMRRRRRDRKSTRLNSSHSQISYAVFCLKKKK